MVAPAVYRAGYVSACVECEWAVRAGRECSRCPRPTPPGEPPRPRVLLRVMVVVVAGVFLSGVWSVLG